jgi:hypothetical protein
MSGEGRDMKKTAIMAVSFAVVASGCLWAGWLWGRAHARIRYVRATPTDAAAGQETQQVGATNNLMGWIPEDFISDLEEGIHFTDGNILSWNPPENWKYANEIRTKWSLMVPPQQVLAGKRDVRLIERKRGLNGSFDYVFSGSKWM